MLRLTYDQNSTGRSDILLSLGDYQRIGDSYYFALDNTFSPGDTSPEKVRGVLARLLQQWHQVLADTRAGDTVFLPFEFGDEYTGWLRCRNVDDHQIMAQVGWSMIPGYAVRPADFQPYQRVVNDFDPVPDSVETVFDRRDLLGQLAKNAEDVVDLHAPATDPTPIFEHFRGSYGTELLTAAVAHFNVFGLLHDEPRDLTLLRAALGLAERPVLVLTTALRAMGLLRRDSQDRFCLTSLAKQHLAPGAAFDVGDYIGLAASSPGVLDMVERLRTNRPRGADSDDGTAFIYRAGEQSAMDQEELARHFTLSLAGRAKNVAPSLAAAVDLSQNKCVLDVGGGTGLYTIALLKRFPHLTGIILDRPEVLRIAAEYRQKYAVEDRLELRAGDMFEDEFPAADVVLLSNVLHDWDVPECERLIAKSAATIPTGGRVLIHDVFLNDHLDGPLPIALYSAALFTLTEGRAYSAGEYTDWLTGVGLQASQPLPTLIHCGVIEGLRL